MENKKKLNILREILSKEENSYADTFNTEILMHIDAFSKNKDFLQSLDSRKMIEDWVNFLKSKIVMYEDDDLVGEIIDEYITTSQFFVQKKLAWLSREVPQDRQVL